MKVTFNPVSFIIWMLLIYAIIAGEIHLGIGVLILVLMIIRPSFEDFIKLD